MSSQTAQIIPKCRPRDAPLALSDERVTDFPRKARPHTNWLQVIAKNEVEATLSTGGHRMQRNMDTCQRRCRRILYTIGRARSSCAPVQEWLRGSTCVSWQWVTLTATLSSVPTVCAPKLNASRRISHYRQAHKGFPFTLH